MCNCSIEFPKILTKSFAAVLTTNVNLIKRFLICLKFKYNSLRLIVQLKITLVSPYSIGACFMLRVVYTTKSIT